MVPRAAAVLALLVVASCASAAEAPPFHPQLKLDSRLTSPDAKLPDVPVVRKRCRYFGEPAPVVEGDRGNNLLENFGRDLDSFSFSNTDCGLSVHKPMYLFPASWSPEYEGPDTEMIFQISLKQRVFNLPLYFGYTQKSFWAVYDGENSRPFRETDYNPEAFWRWLPENPAWNGWGFDLGIEHESNGREVPESRSWNRIYFTPFRASGRNGLALKTWFRIPEDDKKNPEDAEGDDNPDIDDFYGWAELHGYRRIGHDQALHLMLRGNPGTGRGAVQLDYTLPVGGYLFGQLYVWHGYGESLLDYNDSVTRIGIGVALAR
jgi:phospholipase A1